MKCPTCDREVATFKEHGSVLINSHTLDGTLDGLRCPNGLKLAPAEASGGGHIGYRTAPPTSPPDALERGVINGRTRAEWLDLPKAPPASATKAELNAYIVEVAHLLSEAVPTMIRFADEAHTYRQRLRMADERDRTGARQLSERRTELIAMTDQRDRARRETEGLDRELHRANVRHAKDKRRIKALVNALAGLR